MNDRTLLEALVRIPSPTGQEDAAVAFLQDQARADGLRVHTDRAGNFIAEAGHGDRLLLFVGHIDTVPGHIPVRIEDSELWGRGSVDAKGSLAAAYCAARRRLDDPDLRIMVVGAVDEEGRSAGAKALRRDLRPEWIVVGEPSGADGLTLGYKGILRCALRAERPIHHGGHPEPGALDAVVAFWQHLGTEFAFADGFGTVQGRLDMLRSDSDGLRDTVQGRFQLRLPPELSPAAAQQRLRSAADRHGVTVTVTEAMPAAVASRRTPLVASFLAAQRAARLTPHLKHKTGTADFNHLAQWYPGIPIAAYGPGDSHLDHTPHERLALTEFDAAVAVWDDMLTRLAATTLGEAVAPPGQIGTVAAAVW
jgi:[amino group carrier protein]-lysine/ornithine hydrolase